MLRGDTVENILLDLEDFGKLHCHCCQSKQFIFSIQIVSCKDSTST
jgi:hypothetical protein